jgi:coenzyme F420-0:L-glutamate ligase/coenzyme F420-1:gamma-L-glutamate ligase
VVRAAPGVLITRHHSGCVMANAGVDQSNIGAGGEGKALLLPRDPDLSARRLREALGAEAPAVVISDSFGRPWRVGVTNVAIGAAGLPALLDLRGQPDRDGRPLAVTQIALADQLACAAGLVMGEAGEGVPAVLVRGLSWRSADIPASALIRPVAEDLFR